MAEIVETTIQKDTKVCITGWHVLRVLIGLLLLISAGTKAHMLATQPTLAEGFLQSRWFQISVVEFELAFSVWLFVGLMPRVTSCVALVCFTVFTIVSAAKFISGAESCHCFGAVTTPPIYTMLLDLTIIGLLIVFRPQGIVFQWTAYRQELLELKRFRLVGLVAVIWLVLAVPVTHAMMSVEKNDLAELGTEFIGADGKKTILLQPETWIDKEFPLISRFVQPNDSEILKQGTWNVLLAQSDCPKCQEMKSDLEARNAKGIVIVMFPSRENENRPYTPFPLFVLDRQNDWFVTTPCVVKLIDGICVAIGDQVME